MISKEIIEHVINVLSFPMSPTMKAQVKGYFTNKQFASVEEVEKTIDAIYGSNPKLQKYIKNAKRTLRERTGTQ